MHKRYISLTGVVMLYFLVPSPLAESWMFNCIFFFLTRLPIRKTYYIVDFPFSLIRSYWWRRTIHDNTWFNLRWYYFHKRVINIFLFKKKTTKSWHNSACILSRGRSKILGNIIPTSPKGYTSAFYYRLKIMLFKN